MSVYIVTDYLGVASKLSRWMPVVMVTVLFVVLGFHQVVGSHQSRNLLELYRRLQPFEEVIAKSETVILSSHKDVCNYVGHGSCKSIDYSILADLSSSLSLLDLLDKYDVNLFYVDERLLVGLDVEHPKYLPATLIAEDWRLLAYFDARDNKWMLLSKTH